MVTVVVKRTEHLGSFLHGESPVTVVMDPVLYGSPVHDRLQAASFLSGRIGSICLRMGAA